ncbi:hypothetical protein FMM68_12725, partial [Lachnospiraceae bacterium MD329]|nr:hypothetical protein [Lachnospiraceae bacterium MD329]
VTLTPSVQLVTNTELTYTFTENGEHTFTLTDLEGNTLNKTVKVDWIDKEPPTAELSYSTTKFTNKDVKVTVTPSEAVTEDTELSYTFTENGSHTFTITDLAGNSIQKTAEVNWIDKTSDIIKYSETELTNQDVTVEFSPLNSNEEFTHTFTENGEYVFKYTDLDGKQQEKSITVDWIDKELPTAEIVYSTTEPTNKDVEVTVIPSERVIEGEEFKHTFTENGEHIFTLTDLAGNQATIETKVDWIDKEPPEVKKITYLPPKLTKSKVVAIIVASETVRETAKERQHTFEENGIHIFTLTDLAGNSIEVPVEVTWIDKIP